MKIERPLHLDEGYKKILAGRRSSGLAMHCHDCSGKHRARFHIPSKSITSSFYGSDGTYHFGLRIFRTYFQTSVLVDPEIHRHEGHYVSIHWSGHLPGQCSLVQGLSGVLKFSPGAAKRGPMEVMVIPPHTFFID